MFLIQNENTLEILNICTLFTPVINSPFVPKKQTLESFVFVKVIHMPRA